MSALQNRDPPAAWPAARTRSPSEQTTRLHCQAVSLDRPFAQHAIAIRGPTSSASQAAGQARQLFFLLLGD